MSTILANFGLGAAEKLAQSARGAWDSVFGPVLSTVLGQDPNSGVSTPSIFRETLHSAQPDNYELYQMKFQVVDEDQTDDAGNKDLLVEEFDFTVMPESVEIPHQYRTSVIPTMGANIILDGPNLIEAPVTFVISGTFGVNHKVKLNIKDFQGTFNPQFLTGYGLVKRLEKIIAKSKGCNPTTKRPYKSYLINKAFNSYIQVEVTKVTFRQNISRNGLWVYDLAFIQVDPYAYTDSMAESATDLIYDKIIGSMSQQLAQPLINNVIGSISGIL